MIIFLYFQNLARKLESDIKLNHTSFQEAMEEMLEEVTQTETVLSKNSTEILRDVGFFSIIIFSLIHFNFRPPLILRTV